MSSEFRGPQVRPEITGGKSDAGFLATLRDLAPWLAGFIVVVVAVAALSWWVIRPRWPQIQARWPEIVSVVTRIVRPDVVSTPTQLAVQVVHTSTPRPPTRVPLPTPTNTSRPTNTVIPTATSSATVTVAPSPTPPPTPTPIPLVITIGGYVEVFDTGGDGLNVRSEPDTSADKLGKFSDGTVLRVKDGPEEAGGYQWWQVEDEKGLVGWCAADWLRAIVKPESEQHSQ